MRSAIASRCEGAHGIAVRSAIAGRCEGPDNRSCEELSRVGAKGLTTVGAKRYRGSVRGGWQSSVRGAIAGRCEGPDNRRCKGLSRVGARGFACRCEDLSRVGASGLTIVGAKTVAGSVRGGWR